MPACVSVWTATSILTAIATTLRRPAPITTPTANVTITQRRRTLTPRASTSTAPMSTDIAIITPTRVDTTPTMDSAIIVGAMNILREIAEMEPLERIEDGIIIAIIILFNRAEQILKRFLKFQ